MDFKDWQGPALAGLITLVLGLFGVQTYKRKQSKDDLADVENTVAGVHLNNLLEDNARLKRERDEAMQQAHLNHQLYVAEQRRADNLDLEVRRVELQTGIQLERLNHQVTELTKSILKYRPDERESLSRSGFVPLHGDDS